MKPGCLAFALFVLPLAVWANEGLSASSPAGKIELSFPTKASIANDKLLNFQIRFGGKDLMQCELGLTIAGTNIFDKAVAKNSSFCSSNTIYTVLFGKNNPVRDHFNELTLQFETTNCPVEEFELVVRVYDDGLAFRYRVPQRQNADCIEITDEPCRFRMDGDPQVWPLYRENYTTSHEGLYTCCRYSTLSTNQLIDLPLLAQFEDGTSVAFTEANLRNYAGMYLVAEGDPDHRLLRCDLSPLPGRKGIKVRSNLPLISPWRVLLIGSDAGRLLESNLILNLNEPSILADTSWLRFGKTTWYWWNGPYQEPVNFKVDLNFETMKHYIDFCARNGIAFHSVMSTVDEFPWYFQTQKGYGPGPDTDITRARPGLDLPRVVEYGRSKGVGIRLWVHSKPLGDHLEEAFSQYETWGIKGLMVDFLDRDDQDMVLFAERVLQSAARHHLHIHFHGVWKPTGLQRTYPNLFNHEGVLNLEYLKWSDQCGPDHNLDVAFTRLLAGPMDYHLGGFRSVNRDQFKPESIKPNVLGTRCHHLAMYVVYENPMPMLCDAPTAYEGQPGFDFLEQVPTTWDETRVLNNKVGNYIVVARRSGSDWYLGAMTDWTPRVLEVPLGFLGSGPYRVKTWADANGSDDPNQLSLQERRLDAQQKLVLRLRSGGGQAIWLRPTKE
jgi:alpha-glucosidase